MLDKLMNDYQRESGLDPIFLIKGLDEVTYSEEFVLYVIKTIYDKGKNK